MLGFLDDGTKTCDEHLAIFERRLATRQRL
jgi:hypothetical protein